MNKRKWEGELPHQVSTDRQPEVGTPRKLEEATGGGRSPARAAAVLGRGIAPPTRPVDTAVRAAAEEGRRSQAGSTVLVPRSPARRDRPRDRATRWAVAARRRGIQARLECGYTTMKVRTRRRVAGSRRRRGGGETTLDGTY
ncbi:pollen-specific leucine-rich repeat extensin-like protein 4 [Iris pallida]|uniref:Pollen-specific leucine-rich repeat extensin-like protein 4 n=1 Tax=Iris pallida TaxID=29817 RepID=A0AAX6GRQ7_IRIPA|nr:pollen-specific leucine-rich repeat extensin-like protein 4 [Iris pallida]KAJ6831222.1 pollen-specific leucine-rich repeat extensin-like protein 4 [Iris pallida]